MSKAVPLTPIAKTVEKANFRVGEPSERVLHRSYPIPCPGPQGLLLAFVYAPAAIADPNSGFSIYPPSYIAYFHAETAKFAEMKAPETAGLPGANSSDQPIGSYLTPAHRMLP